VRVYCERNRNSPRHPFGRCHARPVVGVAVWKGVAFVGDTIVCIGIAKFVKDAQSWGVKLDSDHEVHVARDIKTQGKCLQRTEKKIVGLHWSAIDCPKGFGGQQRPSFNAHASPGSETCDLARHRRLDPPRPSIMCITLARTMRVVCWWRPLREAALAAG
jgi:hypothetical protein